MKILLSGKYTVRLNANNENINARYEKLKPIDKFKIIRDEPIEEDVVPTNVSQQEKPDPNITITIIFKFTTFINPIFLSILFSFFFKPSKCGI